MPNLTLITGGDGSGKTENVIGLLAAAYEDNPFAAALVLVPTVRHGDQFLRRLVGLCGVTLGLQVETISRFSRRLVSDASVTPQALADELLTRTLRGQVEAGPASYFRPIAGTKGLNAMVRGASVTSWGGNRAGSHVRRCGSDRFGQPDGIRHIQRLHQGASTKGVGASLAGCSKRRSLVEGKECRRQHHRGGRVPPVPWDGACPVASPCPRG